MDSPPASSQAPAQICPHCGGGCAPQQITLTLRCSQFGFAVLRNVPADVCQMCGEAQFSIVTTSQLMTVLQQRMPDDLALIPIFDFTANS
jgi:hypothetical protein